jgi:ribonucleoside-diphosphate reductase alpha chain
MKFNWANDATRTFMARGYLQEGQSVEEKARRIAETAEQILDIPGFADKFYDYLSRGWYSLSSPIWSNFGGKGLPISCNGTYFGDSIAGMLESHAEVATMTKHGAGTSGFFGDIRPRGEAISAGGFADGPVHFMSMIETVIDVISQGNVRRGNFAAYLPVEHPQVKEFLDLREEGSLIQKLSLGITLTDDWMTDLVKGDAEKREIWAKIIRKRYETGYPYLIFIDQANRAAPEWFQGLIKASNLCTEIFQPSSETESFVCCLSSMNLLHYDEWEDTDAVETLVYFLDAVMSEYIEKTDDIPSMERANVAARKWRSIGIGTLGYHSALQEEMIAFESMEAKLFNAQAHKTIYDQAERASRKMAGEYGPAWGVMVRRHAVLTAVAPTTSSSFILGQVSPSIEPIYSNFFTKNLAKGKFTWQNPKLNDVLYDYAGEFSQEFNDFSDLERDIWEDEWIEEQWDSIMKHGGSVQHLVFLTEHERNVFKTFGEISQMEIVQQAASRGIWIDQGQSLNLMIHPKTPAKEVSQLMISAWEMGLKSLYYQRSTNPAQEMVRNILTCSACEA